MTNVDKNVEINLPLEKALLHGKGGVCWLHRCLVYVFLFIG